MSDVLLNKNERNNKLFDGRESENKFDYMSEYSENEYELHRHTKKVF